MADSGQLRQGRQGIARLLVLSAVLFGLFLMHGAPASAASGCHDAMATAATSALGGHENAAMAAMAHPAMPHSDGVRTQVVPGADIRTQAVAGADVRTQAVPGAAKHSGELCVSTPARDRLPLPTRALAALTALAGLTALLWAVRPWRLAGTGRRGPPIGGRGLLLQVCVART